MVFSDEGKIYFFGPQLKLARLFSVDFYDLRYNQYSNNQSVLINGLLLKESRSPNVQIDQNRAFNVLTF